MTAQEFTDVIKKVVQQSSVADTISNLNQPPGRHPSEEIIMLSEFYKSLDENQKSFVDKIMDMVAETTLFGLLCVIDGVRSIEGVGEKGELYLIYKKGEQSVLLNDPNEDFLHDLI